MHGLSTSPCRIPQAAWTPRHWATGLLAERPRCASWRVRSSGPIHGPLPSDVRRRGGRVEGPGCVRGPQCGLGRRSARVCVCVCVCEVGGLVGCVVHHVDHPGDGRPVIGLSLSLERPPSGRCPSRCPRHKSTVRGGEYTRACVPGRSFQYALHPVCHSLTVLCRVDVSCACARCPLPRPPSQATTGPRCQHCATQHFIT